MTKNNQIGEWRDSVIYSAKTNLAFTKKQIVFAAEKIWNADGYCAVMDSIQKSVGNGFWVAACVYVSYEDVKAILDKRSDDAAALAERNAIKGEF